MFRKIFLAKRSALTLTESQQFSDKICQTILQHALFIQSLHIAFYYPICNEVNLLPLFNQAHALKKVCCLPVLSDLQPKTNNPSDSMQFFRYKPNDPLKTNFFSIPEPEASPLNRILAKDFELVLLPLVAFSKTGERLGMGKGYYDQTFAFLNQTAKKKPHLMGVAYTDQEAEKLPQDVWDITLDSVVTERGITRF